MDKKILVFLLAISICLVGYLFFSLEKIDTTNESMISNNSAPQNGKKVPKEPPVDEEDYRTDAKIIFKEVEEIANVTGSFSSSTEEASSSGTREKILAVRDRITSLRAPSKDYKALHVKFALSLVQMEEFLNERRQESREQGLALIDEIKDEYGWIIE